MRMYSFAFIALALTFLWAGTAEGQALTISLVNQDPDPVDAGDVVRLKFKVENRWEDTREDVRVEVLPAYPFTLFSGDPIEYVGRLDGRQYGDNSVIVDFWLKISGDVAAGDHPVDVNLWVGDASYLYDDVFFVDVENEEIRLRAYVRESDLIVGGSNGQITVELANAGEDDLQFVEFEMLPSDGYKLLSTSNYVYIGDLDSDDTETEQFSIYVEEGVTTVDIPVRVSYDVRNKLYSDQLVLHLNLLEEDEAKTLGLITVSYTKYVILGIVLGLVIVYIIRKKKRR